MSQPDRKVEYAYLTLDEAAGAAKVVARELIAKLKVTIEARSTDPEDDARQVVLWLGDREISRETFYT